MLPLKPLSCAETMQISHLLHQRSFSRVLRSITVSATTRSVSLSSKEGPELDELERDAETCRHNSPRPHQPRQIFCQIEEYDPQKQEMKKWTVWQRTTLNRTQELEPEFPRHPPIPILDRLRQGTGERFREEPVTILGIETSCDDTAVGVVDTTRRILGQAKVSQLKEHRQAEGIIPRVARKYHQQNIEEVVHRALEQSGRSLEEVGGVAVTVCPGMRSCLDVGLDYARELALSVGKPLIPVHHMEAHALTARLQDDIPFPYLVLLCSGGHCILAIAEHAHSFSILGNCIDDTPGTVLDKCARTMNLHLHPEVGGLPGGVAIEKLARKGNYKNLVFMENGIAPSLVNCDFSFAGLRTAAMVICEGQSNLGWDQTTPFPMCEDLSAAVQKTAVDHMIVRTQRAMMYCRIKRPEIRHLVVSGGVASNQTLRCKLDEVVKLFDFDLFFPTPDLCTDNGVMIAWAAIERLKAAEEGLPKGQEAKEWIGGGASGICWSEDEMKELQSFNKMPMGPNLSREVTAMNLKSTRNRQKIQKIILDIANKYNC